MIKIKDIYCLHLYTILEKNPRLKPNHDSNPLSPSLVKAHGTVEDVSPGESEGRLEVGRGEDLLAHDARLEPGRVLLHRVKDQVGVLLPEVLKEDKIITTGKVRLGSLKS